MPSTLETDSQAVVAFAAAESTKTSDLELERTSALNVLNDLLVDIEATHTLRQTLKYNIDDAIDRIATRLIATQGALALINLGLKTATELSEDFSLDPNANPDTTHADVLINIDNLTNQKIELTEAIVSMESYILLLEVKSEIQQDAYSTEIGAIVRLEYIIQVLESSVSITDIRTAFFSTLTEFANEVTDANIFHSGEVNQVLRGLNGDASDALRAVFDSDGVPLFLDGASADDIDQAGLGDCWLVAMIAGIAESDPDHLENMIKVVGINEYEVELYDKDGNSFTVTIDQDDIDDFLEENGDSSSRSQEEWVSVLEAALYKSSDKIFSDREGRNLSSGGFEDRTEAYKAITGNDTSDYYVDSPDDSIAERTLDNYITLDEQDTQRSPSGTYDLINDALNDDKPVWASTPDDRRDGAPPGFETSHVFTVIDTYTNNGTQYITLRNPWAGGAGTDNGYFTITMEEFVNNWVGLQVGQ